MGQRTWCGLLICQAFFEQLHAWTEGLLRVLFMMHGTQMPLVLPTACTGALAKDQLPDQRRDLPVQQGRAGCTGLDLHQLDLDTCMVVNRAAE